MAKLHLSLNDPSCYVTFKVAKMQNFPHTTYN